MFSADFKIDPFRFLHSIKLITTEPESELVAVQTSSELRPRNYLPTHYTTTVDKTGLTVTFDRPIQSSHIRTIFNHGVTIENAVASYQEPSKLEDIKSLISQKKIVFAGCARNCAKWINPSLSTLSAIGNQFASYEILVFENDSSDETKWILKRARDSKEFPLTIITQSGLDTKLPHRTQRLAHARNTLLDITLTNFGEHDYLCWVDLDGIIGNSFSTDGFLSNFALERVWDGVFPVTNTFYYDIWALRHPVLSPGDYCSQIDRSDATLGSDFIIGYHAHMRQSRLQNLPAWLSVESAFGGMGIYKIPSIAGARYQGLVDENQICEHVPFNNTIVKTGGKLYINPKFKVEYPENSHRSRTLNRLFFE